MRRACVAILLLAGTPLVARAQTGDFTLPPSGILPNYDRIQVGDMESLEGGAWVARTNDAVAGWYNPAGLVLFEGSALNGSATAYQLNKTTLEGIGKSQSGSNFGSFGTFLGGVLGEPVLKTRAVRLGFFYATPVSWRPSSLDGDLEFPSGAATEALSYETSSSFTTEVFGLAAGFRLADSVRVGISTQYSRTSMYQSQTIADRLTDATMSQTGIRSFVADGTARHFLVAGGVQWDIIPALTLGVQAVTPGLRAGGASKIVYSRVAFSNEGTREIHFRDTGARFEYQLPFRVIAGLAARLGPVNLELDVKIHGASNTYEMFSSDMPASVVTTGADGVPVESSLSFAPVMEKARSVVNVAVGGNVAIGKGFRVHLGFFRDASPVDHEETSIFRRIDLLGATTGVSFTSRHLSGTLGFMWSGGETGPRMIGPSLGGLQGETKIKVTTFNLLYAITYKF